MVFIDDLLLKATEHEVLDFEAFVHISHTMCSNGHFFEKSGTLQRTILAVLRETMKQTGDVFNVTAIEGLLYVDDLPLEAHKREFMDFVLNSRPYLVIVHGSCNPVLHHYSIRELIFWAYWFLRLYLASQMLYGKKLKCGEKICKLCFVINIFVIDAEKPFQLLLKI